jgi:hypothetical protein
VVPLQWPGAIQWIAHTAWCSPLTGIEMPEQRPQCVAFVREVLV